jgi:PleD family two-component response regulator
VGQVRVLIADDHALFAKTLEALLAGTPGLEIVGFADDGLEAVGLAATLCPDVILMDVEMPQLDGIAATRAFEAGATGYLTKDKLTYSLVPAVLVAAEARARLSGDGGAELAGRARVG